MLRPGVSVCYNFWMSQCNDRCNDRLMMINTKAAQIDDREATATQDARELAARMLAKSGYRPQDIVADLALDVKTPQAHETVTVDYAVFIEGRAVMAVKCSMALDSRERHVLSIARLMSTPPAIYAMVTDGLTCHVLDARTGKFLSHDIPTRDEALKSLQSTPALPIAEDRIERERCILLAFEVASCPRPKDKA